MHVEVLAYGPGAGGGSAAARLGRWAADAFGLGDGDRVAVAEVRCANLACPFVHTVVAVLEGDAWPPRQFWLHLPLHAIGREDVLALAGRVSRPASGPTGRTRHPPSGRPGCGA